MRHTFVDANFPLANGRTYHVGTGAGEVANRIITVGHPDRASALSAQLDKVPEPFKLLSDRGFLVITGRYNGVPVSIISIGMGSPNMDFMVRETREIVHGDMIIVRLGSCGGLLDIPVGSVVIPRSSVAITRNLDFDFASDETEEAEEQPYRLSKPAYPDVDLHEAVVKALEAGKPVAYNGRIVSDTVNASADSFYSSQGRITSFPDHNSKLLEQLTGKIEGLATLEMETFHLLHLASIWRPINDAPSPTLLQPSLSLPPAHEPAHLSIQSNSGERLKAPTPHPTPGESRICAAAVHMVFASRSSQDMITPEEVKELEEWTGNSILKAITSFEIPANNVHKEVGSVWEIKTA